VAALLEPPAAGIEVHVEDGLYGGAGGVQHSWILLTGRGPAILDVYAVGSLPTVQLHDLDAALPVMKNYKRPAAVRYYGRCGGSYRGEPFKLWEDALHPIILRGISREAIQTVVREKLADWKESHCRGLRPALLFERTLLTRSSGYPVHVCVYLRRVLVDKTIAEERFSGLTERDFEEPFGRPADPFRCSDIPSTPGTFTTEVQVTVEFDERTLFCETKSIQELDELVAFLEDVPARKYREVSNLLGYAAINIERQLGVLTNGAIVWRKSQQDWVEGLTVERLRADYGLPDHCWTFAVNGLLVKDSYVLKPGDVVVALLKG